MEELILSIVKPLVDHPEDVVITPEETDTSLTYKLSVNKEDMGRVIGKQGRIAKAIRTLVYAVGSKNDKKIRLEIIE
ncbi:KH domain-containing protein [Listeria ivanovii]|uniref:RNA-binding protein KhpA n=2 Tax=Listeria ivanovii TaxID=1638 RepID=A0ABS1G997_LISIV|nr:KH domain-containing protein [Listeria ivanovii]EEA7536797.1 KH domain-containing protein [Listeria monocytogenes]EFR96556.1 protein YlqC [Listeria ivanovii FSL F6-596]AIS60199.1 RNA-binding protein [Listeria ivanovii subsp. londoniensis]AIS63025.1 RNA-binding protein [Listeria ivanovii subsp. londoniensis]MBC2255182.1 KH domain-containing protein [Listeria ivanovii]